MPEHQASSDSLGTQSKPLSARLRRKRGLVSSRRHMELTEWSRTQRRLGLGDIRVAFLRRPSPTACSSRASIPPTLIMQGLGSILARVSPVGLLGCQLAESTQQGFRETSFSADTASIRAVPSQLV